MGGIDVKIDHEPIRRNTGSLRDTASLPQRCLTASITLPRFLAFAHHCLDTDSPMHSSFSTPNTPRHSGHCPSLRCHLLPPLLPPLLPLPTPMPSPPPSPQLLTSHRWPGPVRLHQRVLNTSPHTAAPSHPQPSHRVQHKTHVTHHTPRFSELFGSSVWPYQHSAAHLECSGATAQTPEPRRSSLLVGVRRETISVPNSAAKWLTFSRMRTEELRPCVSPPALKIEADALALCDVELKRWQSQQLL